MNRFAIFKLLRFGGGGCETDMFKHLEAALNVLRKSFQKIY